MLAYAQNRQRIGERGSSPSTMLFIVAAHVAALALAMSIKVVYDRPATKPPIVVQLPREKEELPPPPEPVKERTRRADSTVDRPTVIVPTERSTSEVLDTSPTPTVPVGDLAGNDEVMPQLTPVRPIPDPVRTGPRLNTPESALKPPYPSSKLASQEEASLRLQLSIDERGRVTAVAPVGTVDRAFFESARRHLIARWRFKPATIDGNPVASSTVITLRFQLEG